MVVEKKHERCCILKKEACEVYCVVLVGSAVAGWLPLFLLYYFFYTQLVLIFLKQ